MTDGIIGSIAVALMLAFVAFATAILGPAIGALAGWIVSFIFEEAILKVLSGIGLKGIEVWEFGAFIGFIGGFLKTTVSKSSD